MSHSDTPLVWENSPILRFSFFSSSKELMSQWRLSPSDITYNAAIGACEKGQLRVRASGLVRRQLAAVEDSACRVLKTGELEKKKGRSSKRRARASGRP